MEARSNGGLQISFERVAPNLLHVHMIGNAENSHSDFLDNALEDLGSFCAQQNISTVILDFVKMDFCYSACIRVFTSWMISGVNRPQSLQVYYGRQTWQRTSLVMLGRMSPNCTLIDCSACSHSQTKSNEEQFFAPTGSGSIVTTVVCADCGIEISKSSEYYD